MLAAQIVQLRQQLDRTEILAIDRDGLAFFKPDLDVISFGFCALRGTRHLKNIFRRLSPRVFQDSAFVRDVHEIAISRVRLINCSRYRNTVSLGIGDEIRAPAEFPFAPRRDHFDVRLQGIISEFESHLIVTLARGPMSNCVRALFSRDLDLSFGDHRARQRRAHQVHPFIDRVRFYRRPDVIAHELFAQIFDIKLRTAGGFRFLFQTIHLCTLANIGAVANDFALILVL